MDRRSFLGLALSAAGVAGLAGCTGSSEPTPPGGATSVPPANDDEVRAATFASELQLISQYSAAIATAEPDLSEQLRVIMSQHVEHAQRLRPGEDVPTDPPTSAVPSPESAVPSPDSSVKTPDLSSIGPDSEGSASPGPSPSGSASAEPATPDPATVLSQLRAAERTALAQRRVACEQARDSDLAIALALIAGSEAQHADLLRGWRKELT